MLEGEDTETRQLLFDGYQLGYPGEVMVIVVQLPPSNDQRLILFAGHGAFLPVVGSLINLLPSPPRFDVFGFSDISSCCSAAKASSLHDSVTQC